MVHADFAQLTLLSLAGVYLAGVATSLTPCVYPIIPVVVGYLGSRTGGTGRRLLSSAAYALGLALVYTVLGMVAALTGSMFGSLASNPYVYLAFGVLMLVLGGNMMDWYYIPVPSFAGGTKTGSSGGSLVGPFLMGVTSGLVASPCTAPVLAGLLLFIASTKAVVKGGVMMFAFSAGMSTILLAIGFFAGMANRLPKSGGWMVAVKKALALLMIGAGVYFIFSAGRLS